MSEARCFLSAALRFYPPTYLSAFRLELDPMISLTHGFDFRGRLA